MLFSIEDYLSEDYLKVMKLLSKYDKFYSFVEYKERCWDLRFIKINPQVDVLINRLIKNEENNLIVISKINLYETIKNGIKVVDCSYDQAIALENTKIKLSFDDYRQPYPAFIVKLDDKYREHLKRKYGIPTPNIITVCQNEYNNPISMNFLYKSGHDDFITVICNTNKFLTLEDYLNDLDEQTKEKREFVKTIERVVLNLSLLLTHFGSKIICKSRHPGKKHRNDQQYEIMEPRMQQIKFYERKEINYEYKGGEHKRPHPHWRSGHWLRQVCGVGRTERIRQFRPPVFVCANDYKGEIGDTGVEYKII